MENNEKKNHSLIDLMDASMSKIRENGWTPTPFIGEPIQTAGRPVTLIPRVPARALRLWLRLAGTTASRPPLCSAAPALLV